MSAYWDYKIPKKHWNMRGTPRKLMYFVLYRKQRFMTVLFCWKHGYWGNVSRDAAKLASSSNEWRFKRLHFPTGRSSTPLARGCLTFPGWISTSTKDRSQRERRPGASVLAPEISWSHTLRLFFVGVPKRRSLCTISTYNFGRPKKPYHNCGELSDARYSSSGVERIQPTKICNFSLNKQRYSKYL